MGLSSVLDTNIAIHELHGELDEALPAQGVLISVITEIELLGFSGMTPLEEADVRALIAAFTVIPLNEGIKNETIRVRRTLRLRLPDAIVLATAVVTGSELLTNDLDLIAKAAPLIPCRSLTMETPRLSGWWPEPWVASNLPSRGGSCRRAPCPSTNSQPHKPKRLPCFALGQSVRRSRDTSPLLAPDLPSRLNGRKAVLRSYH